MGQHPLSCCFIVEEKPGMFKSFVATNHENNAYL